MYLRKGCPEAQGFPSSPQCCVSVDAVMDGRLDAGGLPNNAGGLVAG